MSPAVMKESFRTPFSPKYSLIKSVVTNTIGQGRMPMLDETSLDMANLNRFPNKYYYAWGFNMFLNLGFRF